MAGLSITGSTRRAIACSTASGERWLAKVFGLVLLLGAATQPLEASTDVDELLLRTEAPPGVVFEIVEGDEDAMEELLPKVREAIRKLRLEPRVRYFLPPADSHEATTQQVYRELVDCV